VDFERLAYRVRSIIQPNPGFAWGVRVWDPDSGDFSQLAELTRRVLPCAQTLLREGQSGQSPVCAIGPTERQHLLEEPEDNRYVRVRIGWASRAPRQSRNQ
jgi:hypothetical protein